MVCCLLPLRSAYSPPLPLCHQNLRPVFVLFTSAQREIRTFQNFPPPRIIVAKPAALLIASLGNSGSPFFTSRGRQGGRAHAAPSTEEFGRVMRDSELARIHSGRSTGPHLAPVHQFEPRFNGPATNVTKFLTGSTWKYDFHHLKPPRTSTYSLAGLCECGCEGVLVFICRRVCVCEGRRELRVRHDSWPCACQGGWCVDLRRAAFENGEE